MGLLNNNNNICIYIYKSRGERTEYKSYKGINWLRVGGKMYAGIYLDKGFD